MFERIAARVGVAAIGIVVGAIVLSGCTVPPDPPSSTSSASTGSAVFATDEEALAAATEAYAAYLAMSDLILSEGGANPERLENLLTPAQFEEQLTDLAVFQNSGQRTVGTTGFDNQTLQMQSESASGVAEIAIYVCVDISGVRLFDATGVDVTPNDRQERVPFLVSFIGRPTSLAIDGVEVWGGSDFCS